MHACIICIVSYHNWKMLDWRTSLILYKARETNLHQVHNARYISSAYIFRHWALNAIILQFPFNVSDSDLQHSVEF